MKRVIACVILAGLVSAQPSTLSVQPVDGARLELKVYKTGVYNGKVHIFSFPAYAGTLSYDADRPENSRIELKLDATALKLEDKWLNEKDFQEVQRYALEEVLETRKHPEILFRSAAIRATAADRFDVDGTLTIRGIGRPATVKVLLERSNDGQLRFSGTSTVKMTAWGVKPPKALLGLVGTKDEMDFSFHLTVQP